MPEIIPLQQRVGKFRKTQPFTVVDACLEKFTTNQIRHVEILANVAEERQQFQIAQPIRIVHQGKIASGENL